MASVRDRINYLRGSIDAEYDAVLEKLPWWEIALITGAVGVATASFIIACGALGTATGGGALLPCILASVALIGTMIKWIMALGAGDHEANALEEKADELDELVEELEES